MSKDSQPCVYHSIPYPFSAASKMLLDQSDKIPGLPPTLTLPRKGGRGLIASPLAGEADV
jgi:hypothetical protein